MPFARALSSKLVAHAVPALLFSMACRARDDTSSARGAAAQSASAPRALGSAPTTAQPAARADPRAPASSAPNRPGSAPCRVLSLRGAARLLSGAALAAQSPLDGRTWLEIDANAELVVLHALSAREFTLRGAGHFLPCRRGLEQVLMSEGSLVSTSGTGVRPGAEAWIATPFATVRYADAALRVSVAHNSGRVTLQSGGASVDRVAKDGALSAQKLERPKSELLLQTPLDANALVVACRDSADEARSSAARVLAASPAELGQLAAAQLESRRSARTHCLVAEAALDRAEPAIKARLADQLELANDVWQRLPNASDH